MTYGNKQYVIVETLKAASGIEFPQKIYWLDGRCFKVDSVDSIRPLPKSKDGAVCCTVTVNRRPASLYKDSGGWYVIPKERITKESLAAMDRARVLRTMGQKQ